MTQLITYIIPIITFILGVVTTLYFKLEFKKFHDKCKEIEILKNKIGIIYEIALSYMSPQQKQDEYNLHRKEIEGLIGEFNKHKDIAYTARLTSHRAMLVICHDQQDGAKYLDENKTDLVNWFNLFLKECKIETSLIKGSCIKFWKRIKKEFNM